MWCKFTQDNIKFFFDKNNINEENTLLRFIKNERYKIRKFISNNNNNVNIIINNINIDNINFNNYINNWVDKNIINELPHLIYNYYVKWNNNIIIIKSFKNLININNRITLIINIYEYLKYSNNINKNVSIFLILSKLIKKLPNNNDIINIEHVNTGYTDFTNNTIFIWRYEEFEKVLFHEFIHFLHLDNKKIISKYLFNFNEAITDFYGIIYYIIYLSLITNIQIKKLLEIEIAFIKNQASLLSNHLNVVSLSNIIHIKEKTHAFSYYIFKNLIFNYIMLLNKNYDVNNIKNEFKNFNSLYNNLLSISYNFLDSFINLNTTRMTLLQLE